MNQKKSKFNLTFRIISLMLIQAFLVMDIAWAAGGAPILSKHQTETENLAPKLQLNVQVLKSAFFESSKNPKKIAELASVAKEENVASKDSRATLSGALKNVVVMALLFIMLVLPFASPSLSAASEKQAQAPPAITLAQQELQNDLIQISRQSRHEQLNDAGELTTIRANLRKGLDFSNSKARERVDQINALANRLWISAEIKGELDEYITKRGDSVEAIAIGKALLILKYAAPQTYQGLIENNVSIFIGDISYYGYARGSRFFGIAGKPLLFLDEDYLNNPFKMAMILSHEGRHAIQLPNNLIESMLEYNLVQLVVDLFSEMPRKEKDAFSAQSKFSEYFKIIPITGELFYDSLKLEAAYYGQKMQKVFLDLIGTVLFNVMPLFAFFGAGVGVKKIRQRNQQKESRRSAVGVLSSKKAVNRQLRKNVDAINRIRRSDRNSSALSTVGRFALIPARITVALLKLIIGRNKNKFRSIILLPFILFQFISFFNADISQSAELLTAPQENVQTVDYKKASILDSSGKTVIVKNTGLGRATLTGVFTVMGASFANLFSAANLWAMENGVDKALTSYDLKTTLTSLFIIFGIGVLMVWNKSREAKAQEKRKEQILIPTKEVDKGLKELDATIRTLIKEKEEAQKKENEKAKKEGRFPRVIPIVLGLDGASGAGKTPFAYYLKAVGIGGLDPSEIGVLSRDDHVVGRDYTEANLSILDKSLHNVKLIILDGNGIQLASNAMKKDPAYAELDISAKIILGEDAREEKIRAKIPKLSESEVRGRIKVKEPSSEFNFTMKPYGNANILIKSAEYAKVDWDWEEHANDHDPAVAKIREFVVDQIIASDRRDFIIYHNEKHLNELFNFSDVLSKYLPYKDRERSDRLMHTAIYLHDLGYLESDETYLRTNHEQRSIEKFKIFVRENPNLLTAQEVDSLIYMIDMTQMEGRVGAPFEKRVKRDNRIYQHLAELEANREHTLKDDDMLHLKNIFPSSDINNSKDRQLIMDTLIGGKIIALADIWGGEEGYLYMVALLSEEFRYDKEHGDATVPAAMTNIKQIGESSGFHDGFAMPKRLIFLLVDSEFPDMGMQKYLDLEQKAKENDGDKDKSQIDKRITMLNKSKHYKRMVDELENGVDENLVMLNLDKNTQDLYQVKEIKKFIEAGVQLGIYDQARKKQLLSEINVLIDRGQDKQRKLIEDAAFPEKMRPTVELALEKSGVFKSFSETEIAELRSSWKIKNFSKEDKKPIIEQGDTESKSVYLVIDGDLDIFVYGVRVGQMSEGVIFGEMAVVENVPRNATIRVSNYASRQAVIAEIPADVFRKMFSQNGEFQEDIEGLIEERHERTDERLDEEAGKDEEESLKDKFEQGQLDTVAFFDVDLMRLTNQFVAKKNVNLLLDGLEEEFNNAIKDMGFENAVSLRRGGDEFVFAINTNLDKQLARDIVSKIKRKVQSAKFAVASIGTEEPSAKQIEIIEKLGGAIDKIGRHNIVIVPQKVGDKTGKDRVWEILDIVNIQVLEGEKLSIKRSWLNLSAVGNEVSFTLSIGLANITEIDEVSGANLYEKARNLAAQRKDKSKETFKELGDGHIEGDSPFERSGVAGESILLTDEAIADFEAFIQMQADANLMEDDGLISGFEVDSSLLYFSNDNPMRSFLNNLMQNKKTKGIIPFSLQGLGYFDNVGRIDGYKVEYYNSPGSVKDNRIDINDFKVNNEAWGYVAGDEMIALLRMSALKYAKLFENFNVIFARGPPAGPNGFLVPKTKQAEEMDPAAVQEMFIGYMQQVKEYLNKSGKAKIKVGHLRVIWDKVRLDDENIGDSMGRISQARSVYEHIVRPEKAVDRVFQYDDSIQENWIALEEANAWEAVEQLENLQAQWQVNKQKIDSLLSDQIISGTLTIPGVQSWNPQQYSYLTTTAVSFSDTEFVITNSRGKQVVVNGASLSTLQSLNIQSGDLLRIDIEGPYAEEVLQEIITISRGENPDNYAHSSTQNAQEWNADKIDPALSGGSFSAKGDTLNREALNISTVESAI